ncbi:TonB family protein [Dyadobacter sp. CY261]|uniref:energy transducer TonB n=1 Tax=Dyadobacter sp. CY261 TaxID=2907203 RepID=UPI001F16973F|nr:energy transducer TonB [Dyadobacter sp. CY261]MCF0071122.1 TonB family protein [Dyadobacter sp. CY261]
MNYYTAFLVISIFHAGLLTCQKPAPDIGEQKAADTNNVVIEEKIIDGDFYDNMPNALEGSETISIPNDFIPIEVDVQPQFPGGKAALQRYIDKYLQTPPSVRQIKITGKVYTSFVISETGEIQEATVVKSLRFDCDQAALQLINYMPKWKPARKGGKPVSIRHYLEIPFDFRTQ